MTTIKEIGVHVTVNTDAGFYPKHQVGTYAYWIKGTGMKITGSGVFKNKKKKSSDCEILAIIKALDAIKKAGHPPIIGFIFNRDCLSAIADIEGNKLQQSLFHHINYFRKDAIRRGYKNIHVKPNYARFKHVPAHTDNKNRRSGANAWCDNQCRERFKEWYDKNKTSNI